MAFEEYIRRAILTGRTYDDLPARVKAILPLNEWRAKVRDFCIQRGYPWATSAARHVCGEQEYYEDLLASYRAWARIFPYHLAEYVCRVQRATPFRYYCEVLALTLREERPYDSIPNFTAADALRVTGVGRNEYISILNACKAKKLMWRVNRAIAKDLLPQVEQELRLEPWWLVAVANVGETEWRELSQDESDLLKTACDANKGPHTASRFDQSLLRALHRRGLVYIDVPVGPDDRFSIPPLEGFVSNKTIDASDSGSDPVEVLLYSAFVASSERIALADLAGILNMAVEELQVAMSVACRLGFATRLATAGDSAPPSTAGTPPRLPLGSAGGGALSIPDDEGGAAGVSAGGASASATPPPHLRPGSSSGLRGDECQAAIAVVVDSEATSCLMMGALSPGLKRHAVSLFEAGRVSGGEVVSELLRELWASYEAGKGFEGEMRRLTNYCAALATLLEAAQSPGAGAAGTPLELVRKESLAGLDPSAASKVMRHAYCAVLPIAPLPGPPLPLNPFRPGPTNYGPTPEAASPWLQLALYCASGMGPLSLVLAAGQRLWRLPPQLEHCSHALLWSWDPEPRANMEGPPQLVEGALLLASLNEMLSRAPVMAQPLLFSEPVGSDGDAGGQGAAPAAAPAPAPEVELADVALPLRAASDAAAGDDGAAAPPAKQRASSRGGAAADLPPGGGPLRVRAVHRRSGRHEEVDLPAAVVRALGRLGLERAVGYLRLVRVTRGGRHGGGGGGGGGGEPEAPSPSPAAGAAGAAAGGEAAGQWLPLAIQQGVPLHNLQLCRDVCAAAVAAEFLSPARRAQHAISSQLLHARLWHLIARSGGGGGYAGAGGGGGGGAGAVSDAGPETPASVAAGLGELAAYAELPPGNLLFDGTDLRPLDLEDCQQGIAAFCA
ncbi:hypothetical protein Rsub_08021 [Raphidocelis subcapitata]|uniref:FAM91 N-terminal domain-containing protein n=1 Tax=Raphidocelis subcapitata TaxID=307507 RepID=A0A2V0P5K3_9CHLO|nr:hypothetical protein Rsub_08021 [Raphidocelis subcapitata]|eukprot:GBF94849.1 hypothetical protein Rsub_08021 [Raphidocelis subcapitata]